MTARFALSDASRPLVLDFAPGAGNVKSVRVNGATPVTATFPQDHIVVPAAALRARRRPRCASSSRPATRSLNRNPDFLYALFVPARAHLAIPVFDQPDLKARWTLTLTLPRRLAGSQQRRAGHRRRDCALGRADGKRQRR